jgi:Lon protease-like protein
VRVAQVGCVVDVNSYLRIPDGRSLLLVKGTSRFSVRKRWESTEHGYEIAEVRCLASSSP